MGEVFGWCAIEEKNEERLDSRGVVLGDGVLGGGPKAFELGRLKRSSLI